MRLKKIRKLLEEHDKCEEAYEKERINLYESTVKASGGQSVVFNKVQELRKQENKNANDMNEKYQVEQMSMLQKVTNHSSSHLTCMSSWRPSSAWGAAVCAPGPGSQTSAGNLSSRHAHCNPGIRKV